MKVLLSWMREFIPGGFGDLESDPEALSEVMTNLGLVVESVDHIGGGWEGIVVAKVLSLRPHPEADKIQLVDVDTGGAASPAGEPLQICCGAFNMAEGDLVPLATLGTVMPGGLDIARRKLRGQWSNGMLCSATELGMGDDADGIMVLGAGLPVGQPLADALGIESDVLFDIDVEGNRPDGLSVAGVARDVAAKLKLPFVFPEISLTECEPASSARGSVEILDNVLCKRFGFRILDGITMGQSPQWMQQRLDAAGMRPINVVVDISNYVMLELGQPNHTYDLSLVPDGAISVRMARSGEVLETLDGQQRALIEADGLICNSADVPIGLAGVMGGASTEISDGTTSVLLEAAVWDQMTIAWTSRRLGLRSEASTRFERGVDPRGIERALDRFCELAIELCGATVATDAVVVDGGLAPAPEVKVRRSKVNHLLNTDLTLDEIEGYLTPIGFVTVSRADDHLVVRVPTWRPDSSIEEDIVEEVGRHHGYEKSGSRVPTSSQTGSLSPTQKGRRRIRRAFLAEGFNEAMPLPFLAPGDLARAGLDEHGISLANPLVAEESILRTSLLPGLLKSLAYNQSHRGTGARLYEVGHIYLPSDDELPIEQEWVAAAAAGSDARSAVECLNRLAAALNLQGLKIVNGPRPGLHPTRSAEVQFWGKPLGEVGEVDPGVLEAFGVDGRVAWLQLRLPPIVRALQTPPKFKSVSRYPSSDIDLAFVVPESVPASDVANTIKKAGASLVKSVDLFDVFRSESLGADVRSLAYRLRLQADDHTLTDDEATKARDKMIQAVEERHSASLR